LKIKEVQFNFACAEMIILYLFNDNAGKINQYQELVNVGELQCLGMAGAKFSNIGTRFIIPSEDPVLNMTIVSAGTQTRALRVTYMLLWKKFLVPALDGYRKSGHKFLPNLTTCDSLFKI